MIVLGFDPGYAIIGWGIVEFNHTKATALAYGTCITKPEDSEEVRLSYAYDEVVRLFKKFNPEVVAIETLFFTTNAKTAIAVGQGRGMLLVACGQHKIPVFSYTPLEVKTAITGYGKADKHQMQAMVQSLLKLSKKPEPDDAADALAVAITHCYTRKFT